jgi:hypothetical protein
MFLKTVAATSLFQHIYVRRLALTCVLFMFEALVEGDVNTVAVYLRGDCEGIDMNYRNAGEVDRIRS